MHEDVLARLRGDKAKALLGVEPFHGSNRHVLVPPSVISEVSINARPATARIRRWVEVLPPPPAPKSEAGWTCGGSQRMLPSPNGGASARQGRCRAATAGPSLHNADSRIRWWSRSSAVGVVGQQTGSRRAATGVRNNRRVSSETMEDHDRRSLAS